MKDKERQIDEYFELRCFEDIKEDSSWLMKGDCLERMKEIPDGSVDLILSYNIRLDRKYQVKRRCLPS